MIRTGFSFGVAAGHLPNVMSRLEEIGWKVAPISDRNSTFAFMRWTKLKRLRPIYGVELGVVPEFGSTKSPIDYWKFLAIDSLEPLHELIFKATSSPDRTPTITYKQAAEAQGLIKISGERVLLEHIRPSEDFYFGLSVALSKGLLNAAIKEKLPIIANQNNFYPREEDKEFYRVMIKRSSTQTYAQHILSDGEWGAHFPNHMAVAALNVRDEVFARCVATIKTATLLKPEKPKGLRELCIEGAAKLGVNLSNKVYADRMDRELAMIEEKKFEDYFFIIADLVNWAKERMIVGPARGSSCGSLVCFLLGITAVDPIPFNLLFERFIDTTRSDLPDIDLDFSDVNRYKVFDYAEEKYGKDRVARLGTVGLFKPRSALQQAGVALRVPRWMINKVLDNIIIRSSGDARALQQIEDTLADTEAGRDLMEKNPEIRIAGAMEGHPNNASQHAAGIVITEDPVMKYVAVDARTKSTMCDKKDAEAFNLLKIDALGLTQLSIFERTLELIGVEPKSGWLEKIPLDDPLAFEILNNQHFAGIFQFMGGALKSLVKQITVTSIDDMIAITALARPGPLVSGGANAWVRRKRGDEKVSYPHPLFEPYISDTLGIVTYQEQVMEIGRQVGDLSWEEVTALRQAMSRSLGKEFFNKFGDPWKTAAHAKGIPMDVLDKIWDDLCAYGSWSFNKSHAVAYGIVSYWCCWLKAHYKLEFAAATLDAESQPSRQLDLLRELHEEGIEYVAIDPEHSIDRWVPVAKNNSRVLVGPLSNVKGIGPVKVAQILDARKQGLSLDDLKPALKKLLANAKTEIDTLTPIGDRVRSLVPRLHDLNHITPVREVQMGFRGSVLVVAVARRIVPRDENEAIKIAQRGGKRVERGPTASLNLFVQDDTDEIFCKIGRYDFERLGRAVVERGRAGRAIYVIKGTVPHDFRMIKVTQIKYVGDMDEEMISGDRRGTEEDISGSPSTLSLASD